MKNAAEATYSVFVGNIGMVKTNLEYGDAKKDFDLYVARSKSGKGKAAHESVSLWVRFNGCEEPIEEYNPA